MPAAYLPVTGASAPAASGSPETASVGRPRTRRWRFDHITPPPFLPL
jgi:hypothetical protein